MATMTLPAMAFSRLPPPHTAFGRAEGPLAFHWSATFARSARSSILRGARRARCSGYGSLARRHEPCFVRAERKSGAGRVDEAVDVSVLRFTLGIPGFDESDLPGILGTIFGGLLILNHVFSGGSITAAQTRSEGVGLILAAASISLPSIGRQLWGKTVTQSQPMSGQKQIFSLVDGLSDIQRNDLAWLSYNLMRNTSTTAMLVWHSDRVVAARGFWEVATDSAVTQPTIILQRRLNSKLDEFLNLKEPLYLSSNAASRGWEFMPGGAASALIQPFPKGSLSEIGTSAEGLLILISNTAGGYNKKDRLWTKFLAQKISVLLSR